MMDMFEHSLSSSFLFFFLPSVALLSKCLRISVSGIVLYVNKESSNLSSLLFFFLELLFSGRMNRSFQHYTVVLVPRLEPPRRNWATSRLLELSCKPWRRL